VVVGATINSTKYQVMTLKHGRGAYTYLKFEYPTTTTSTSPKPWLPAPAITS
jgi:hypothetical protein